MICSAYVFILFLIFILNLIWALQFIRDNALMIATIVFSPILAWALHMTVKSIVDFVCIPGSDDNNPELEERTCQNLFASSDAVCFDVDSTVCEDEAIDEIAAFANKKEEVKELTEQAMAGGLNFTEGLAQSLELIQPTVQMITDYLQSYPPKYTPGIKELISLLQACGTAVYLVSGGFYSVIKPIAQDLGIPAENIFANRIKFFYDGTYAGFDESQPTSRQGGKAEVIAYLKRHYQYSCVTMIGDGVTDLEACPPADAFIGFGGNQIRERVKKEAKWFVTSFYELIEELNRN